MICVGKIKDNRLVTDDTQTQSILVASIQNESNHSIDREHQKIYSAFPHLTQSTKF